MSTSWPGAVDSRAFFATYHGHDAAALRAAEPALRGPAGRRVVWLVGDSSLDNKAWVADSRAAASNGYAAVLTPPTVVADVAHHINLELETRGGGVVAVNAAVEESTLGERAGGALLPQDVVVRDRLRADDILVVSVGGNDIALRPTACTAAALLALTRLASDRAVEDGSAWGLGHFVALFRDAVQAYVGALCARCTPRTVVVCMIYFPHERRGSWADTALSVMRYDDPVGRARVQAIIRALFRLATSRVAAPAGARVVPLPLYEVLDSRAESRDFVSRVEPSVSGGRKMAAAIVRAALDAETEARVPS